MGQSAWKIAEAKSAAQEKPQENSLQSETAVDALLGQSGETTTSLLSQRQDGVDADRISSPVLSPIASLKPPSMAPGVGGFNIDLPVPRESLATGKAAVAHTRRESSTAFERLWKSQFRTRRLASLRLRRRRWVVLCKTVQ